MEVDEVDDGLLNRPGPSTIADNDSNVVVEDMETSKEDCISKTNIFPKFTRYTKFPPGSEIIDPNIIVIKDDNEDMEIDIAQTPFMAHNALYYVLKHLQLKDIINVSKVCSTWNSVAKSNTFWRNLKLKDVSIFDWELFAKNMKNQRTVSLDTEFMFIPDKLYYDYDIFWGKFSSSLQEAIYLKNLTLCECPTFVIDLLKTSQLEVLKARSLSNRTLTTTPSQFMSLDMTNLNFMTNLTVINLRGLNEMKLNTFPKFDKMPNLRSLSLTNIIAFPRNRYDKLKMITTDLEILEIGDCECLCLRFLDVLKRFVNLKKLRLENCRYKWDKFGQQAFTTINTLEKLEVLELIDIDLSESIQKGLMTAICKSILLVPLYPGLQVTNRVVLDCALKLHHTTRFHWGISTNLMPKVNPDAETTYLIDYMDTDYMENSDFGIPLLGELVKDPICNKIKFEGNEDSDIPLSLIKSYMGELFDEFKVIYVPMLESTKLQMDTDYSK